MSLFDFNSILEEYHNEMDFSEMGYPLDECGVLELEKDINEDYISIIESIYVMNIEKTKYSVIQENTFKIFINKVKEFFKQLWDRIKKFFSWVKSLFTKKIKNLQTTAKDKELVSENLPEILETIENSMDEEELKQLSGSGVDIGNMPSNVQTQYISKILQTGTNSPMKNLPKNIQTEIINNIIKIQTFVKEEIGEGAKASKEMRKKELIEKYVLRVCPLAESVEEGTIYLKKEIHPIPLSPDVYKNISTGSLDWILLAAKNCVVHGIRNEGVIAYDTFDRNVEDFYKNVEEKFKTRSLNNIDLDTIYANNFKDEPSYIYITNGYRIWKEPYFINIKEEISKLEKENENEKKNVERLIKKVDENSTNEEEKQANIRIIEFFKQILVFNLKFNNYKINYLNKYLDVHKRVIEDIGPILRFLIK